MPRATATATARAKPPPSQPPEQPGSLAAATAATAAAGVAHPPPVAPTVAAAGQATKPILKALKRMFATRSSTLSDDLLLLLRREHPDLGEKYLKEIVADELRLEGVFQRRARARVKVGVEKAMLEPDAQARRGALQKVLDAEKRYAKLREESLIRRMTGRVDMLRLKLESPKGAYWKLGDGVKEHTLDCLVMGEKWWPWEVLERINPANRHHGCACRLVGFRDAERLGWITEDLIPDPKDALARARRYAEDVPEIRAAFTNDKGELMEASIRGVLADIIPDIRLRWPKGWSFGGRFRPVRGGTPGVRTLRANVPHAPESPTVSRDQRRGRHVPIDGDLTFIPEQEDWGKRVGKTEFTSPRGGTNVYRNGKLVSEPGRPGKHPDVQRKAMRSPVIEAPVVHGFDRDRTMVRGDLIARVDARADALDPDMPPVEVGDPPSAVTALEDRFLCVRNSPGGQTTDYWDSTTGAVLTVTLDRGKIAEVTWLPDGVPVEEGRTALTTPRDFETFRRDLLSWSEDLAAEYGVARLTRDADIGEEFPDHSGQQNWDGRIHLGVDVPDSIDAVGRAVSQDRELTPYEARMAYFSYRLASHEMSHGINPIDHRTYLENRLQFALEEGMAEEVSTVLSVDRLKKHGNEETLRWLAEHVGTDPGTDGNYLEQRAVLESALTEAMVPPELWEDTIFDLKFRVPPKDRPGVLTLMVADARDCSTDEAADRLAAAADRVEAGVAPSVATSPFGHYAANHRPLLAADLEPYAPPESDEITVGNTVRYTEDGIDYEGVVVKTDLIGGTLTVADPTGVAQIPRERLTLLQGAIHYEGDDYKVGDTITYGRTDGGTSEARITRIIRPGRNWEIEAVTTDNSAKPDQPIRLTPERVLGRRGVSSDTSYTGRTPVEIADDWHRTRRGDRFSGMQSPGMGQIDTLDKETVERVTDDAMQGIEAFGPLDWEENYRGNPSEPLHGGETREGWRKFIADNADALTQERADKANAELRADPRWRRIEEKWGRNAVIGHGGMYFMHPDFFSHPDASRYGGVTYLFPAGALRPQENTGPRPGGGSVTMGLPAVLRHEYAHSLWKKLGYGGQGEFHRLIPKITPDANVIANEVVSRDLSPYPQETPHVTEETFTEAFALAFDPRYNPDDFAPWVQDAVGWIQDKFDPEGASDPGAMERRVRGSMMSPPQGEMIRQHLEAMGRMRALHDMKAPEDWTYSSIDDFLLREGTGYDAPDVMLPEKYEKFRGRKKECFRNAGLMAMENPELTYVEGYAVPDSVPIPLAHAWVIDEDGKVIDPTWDGAHEYWGVTVPTDLLQTWVVRTETWGLIDDWENHYPVLRKPWKDTLENGPDIDRGMASPGFAPRIASREPPVVPPGAALPPGVLELGGDRVTPDELPPELYHVTTRRSGVEETGYLLAGGAGTGLGGAGGSESPEDRQAVSMTPSREGARHIAREFRWLVELVHKYRDGQVASPEVEAPAAALERPHVRAWGEPRPEVFPPLTDEQVAELKEDLILKAEEQAWKFVPGTRDWRTVKAWHQTFMTQRNVKTTLSDPYFIRNDEELAQIDPEEIGVVRIPRDSLRTGAAIREVDDASGREIRHYGDVKISDKPITMNSPPLVEPVRAEVGGTPFRPGDEGEALQAKLADYDRRWAEAAERLGLPLENVPQEGFWGGEPEPSVASRTVADPTKLVAAAAVVGRFYDQDAMAVFLYDDGPGGRFSVRIPEGTDRAHLDELIAGAMPEGQGASVAGDEAYFYAADAAEGEAWAEDLAEALDSDATAQRGTFLLISDASYGDRTYTESIEASPEARALDREWGDAAGEGPGGGAAAQSQGGEGPGGPEAPEGLASPGATRPVWVHSTSEHEFAPGDYVEPASAIGHDSPWKTFPGYSPDQVYLWDAGAMGDPHWREGYVYPMADDPAYRHYEVEPLGPTSPDPEIEANKNEEHPEWYYPYWHVAPRARVVREIPVEELHGMRTDQYRGSPQSELNSPGIDRVAGFTDQLRNMEVGDVLVGDLPGVRVVRNPEREEKPGTINLLGGPSGGYMVHGYAQFGMPIVTEVGDEEDLAKLMVVPEGMPDAQGTLGDPAVGIEFFNGFNDRGMRALVNRVEYLPDRYGKNSIKYQGAFFIPEAEGTGSAAAQGQFEITFTRRKDGTWEAYTDWINAFQTDTGFGTNFHNWLRDSYPEIGVKSVKFRAAKTGSYVWAKAGYEFRGDRAIKRGAARQVAALGWDDLVYDIETLREEGIVDISDEKLAEFLHHFPGLSGSPIDRDGMLNWEESAAGQRAWEREVQGLTGEFFETPQEIAMWGIEDAWTETINGREVKMWLGKKLLLQSGVEWDAEYVYPDVTETVSGIELAAMAEQVAREWKLRVPPDDVDLNDLDFWIEVMARLKHG